MPRFPASMASPHPWRAPAAAALGARRLLALAACAAACAAGGQTPPPVAPAGLLALAQRAASDPACAQPQVIGACFCGPIPCGVRILQFVPVAFIETTKAPGDSIFAPAGAAALPGAASATVSSSLSTTDNTAEVHVWTLPDAALPASICLLCKPSSAAAPMAPTDPPVSACGAVDALLQSAFGSGAAAGDRALPRLTYASEADAFNWHTGCRDLAAGPTDVLRCAAGGAGLVQGALGDPACIGLWGPLKPRQMRDIGPTPVLHSAKTSVRAMSIARTQLGDFPYPVDIAGKLQQAYPVASACFLVGQLPLPQPPLPLPTVPSPDGRYGWLYWRPTTCCVKPGNVAQCLGAALAHD